MTHGEARVILSVPPGVQDANAIRRAWLAFADKNHPDHGGSHAAFLVGQEAYRVLLTPEGSPVPGPTASGRDGVRTAIRVARQVASTPGVARNLADTLRAIADAADALLREADESA